jgi:hypothetical protein
MVGFFATRWCGPRAPHADQREGSPQLHHETVYASSCATSTTTSTSTHPVPHVGKSSAAQRCIDGLVVRMSGEGRASGRHNGPYRHEAARYCRPSLSKKPGIVWQQATAVTRAAHAVFPERLVDEAVAATFREGVQPVRTTWTKNAHVISGESRTGSHSTRM